MAVVPGLLAAAWPGTDTVTFLVATSVIVVLAIEIVLVRRQHDHLWHELRHQAQRLDQLLRDSRDAIVQVDDGGVVEFANDAVRDVFGYEPRILVGQNGIVLIHPKDRAGIRGEVDRLNRGEQDWVRVSGRFRDAAGQWRHLESTVSRRTGGASGYTLSVRDISERNRMEVELRRLASTDDLTGLLNRQAFLALLENRLPRGDASVLFIDLDGFKSVNDTAGHAAGDRLLREVADALRAEMRPGDIAARLGGDEFAVLPAVRSLEGARALAARLVDCLSRTPSQAQHRIGASIGVAAGHHATAQALLSMADLAMYEAKAAGGGGYLVFQPGGGDEAVLGRRREPERADSAEGPDGVVDVREPSRSESTILADQ
jgi:diguanylate cyclase (GGDEF)-like protein/PAS domain S-box-containing protein